MNLLFIRHAETDMAGTFCGHSDPPVNHRGHQQISNLLHQLQHVPIDIVHTSDLVRATTTAAILAHAHGTKIVTNTDLREIHFGMWEGLTWQRVQAADPTSAQRWIDCFPNLPAPDGESFAVFQQRVLTAVNTLHRQTDHRHGAIVTHAGVMRVVLEALCGFSQKEAWDLTSTYCSSFNFPYPVKP